MTALRLAVDRANAIQELIVQAGVPLDRVTLIAVTMVSATAGMQFGLSCNDAFSLYLSVYEGAERDAKESVATMFARMKNSVQELIEQGLVPETPKKKPH